MTMIQIPEELFDEIVSKLTDICTDGFNRYTDVYIVPYNKYSYEEQMKIGDSWAFEIVEKLKKIRDGAEE